MTARVEVPGTYLLGRLVVEVAWYHDVSIPKLLVIVIEVMCVTVVDSCTVRT